MQSLSSMSFYKLKSSTYNTMPGTVLIAKKFRRY